MPRAIRQEDKRAELLGEMQSMMAPGTSVMDMGGIVIEIQDADGNLRWMWDHSRWADDAHPKAPRDRF